MTPEELIDYYQNQIYYAERKVRYWEAMKQEAEEALNRVKKENIAPVIVGS